MTSHQSFAKFYGDMMRAQDVDPAFAVINELFKRYELSKEQQYWVAFIYTMFYHNASTFLFMQEFPELEKVDLNRLERWYKQNGKHLQFQKDRKAIKLDAARLGGIVRCVADYKAMIGPRSTQQDFFERFLEENDQAGLWKALNSVTYIKRHAALAWWETLVRCVDVPLGDQNLDDILFHKSAKSSYEGLKYATGKDNPTRSDYDKLLKLTERSNTDVDNMYMETVLCAYKKLHLGNMYVGYYLDRMQTEIEEGGEQRMSNISTGVNWGTLWEIRREIFDHQYLGERGGWHGWRPNLKKSAIKQYQ
jgi:Alpha-glutamyl/putrescinyl thymine pyrophosphorylase clade 2